MTTPCSGSGSIRFRFVWAIGRDSVRIWFHPFPVCLGYRQKQRMGNPSELFFLDPERAAARRVHLPDAVSQLIPGRGPFWYIGCRNGTLYQFSSDGLNLWDWRMPAGRRHGIPPLVAPFLCATSQPYLHLAASSDQVVVAEGQCFYVLSSYGEERWRARIPGTRLGEIALPPPEEVPTRRSLLQKLRIEGPADSLRAGYLRLALAPDANPSASRPQWMKPLVFYGDETSTVDDTGAAPVGVEFEIGEEGSGETITAVAAAEESVLVGSSEGMLYAFDRGGDLRKAFHLGDAPVSRISLGPHGHCWTYSGGRLTVVQGFQIAGAVQLPDYFMEMVPLGDDLLVWKAKECWVIGSDGRVLWRAEFARPIRSAVVDELGFWILAGPLYRFRRSQTGAATAEAE